MGKRGALPRKRGVRNFCGEGAESSLQRDGVRTLEDDQDDGLTSLVLPSPPTLSLNGGSCPGVGWNGWDAFPRIGNGEATVPSAPVGMGSWPS